MNQLLKGRYEPFFKSGLPWIRFSSLLGTVGLIFSLEWNFLTKQKASNADGTRSLELIEESNRQNELRSEKAITKGKALIEGAESVLGQILKADEDPNLTSLETGGLRDYETVRDAAAVQVKFSTHKIAYHALIPALNQQEVNTPLMRCNWLSLKSTGRPFHKTALPLQVDLELAFPRITTTETNSTTGSHVRKAQ